MRHKFLSLAMLKKTHGHLFSQVGSRPQIIIDTNMPGKNNLPHPWLTSFSAKDVEVSMSYCWKNLSPRIQ